MSSKRLKTELQNYKTTILILAVFAINSVTASWLDVMGYADPATCVEWHDQIVLLRTAQSWFEFVPYLLVGLMAWKKFDMDIFDLVLLGICIASCIVTTWDFYNNDNERATGLDWRAFLTAILFIILLKISWKGLLKIISKTQH